MDYLNCTYDYSHCEDQHTDDDHDQDADRDGDRFLKKTGVCSLRRGFSGIFYHIIRVIGKDRTKYRCAQFACTVRFTQFCVRLGLIFRQR